MSLQPNIERIAPKASQLGEGLTIQRALPTRQRRMVGAWCFLDHIGPMTFAPGEGLHVGAHPHTCLQTFTWMIEGEILHRDSLGSEQIIRPGQVNLMTAGHGIVHTEDSATAGQRVHAAQLWIALPRPLADCAPAFEHYPSLPQWTHAGCNFTLLVGSHDGYTAPTRVHTPLLGMDIASTQQANVTLALNPRFEHAILPLEGEVTIGQQRFVQDEFAFIASGVEQLPLQLAPGSRILLIGGEPFAEPIVMWWNFVGFSKEAISAAQGEWETGAARFGRVKGDEGRRLVAPALLW